MHGWVDGITHDVSFQAFTLPRLFPLPQPIDDRQDRNLFGSNHEIMSQKSQMMRETKQQHREYYIGKDGRMSTNHPEEEDTDEELTMSRGETLIEFSGNNRDEEFRCQPTKKSCEEWENQESAITEGGFFRHQDLIVFFSRFTMGNEGKSGNGGMRVMKSTDKDKEMNLGESMVGRMDG